MAAPIAEILRTTDVVRQRRLLRSAGWGHEEDQPVRPHLRARNGLASELGVQRPEGASVEDRASSEPEPSREPSVEQVGASASRASKRPRGEGAEPGAGASSERASVSRAPNAKLAGEPVSVDDTLQARGDKNVEGRREPSLERERAVARAERRAGAERETMRRGHDASLTPPVADPRARLRKIGLRLARAFWSCARCLRRPANLAGLPPE